MSTKTAAMLRWPKLLLLGDSQTQKSYGPDGCWASLLSNHYQRRCDVINRGFSGYNSRWIKEMLPQLIDSDLAKDCVAVTLFLGSNDANDQTVNHQQHVPLHEYKNNLKCISQYIMDCGVSKEKIILISPPPVDEELWSRRLRERDPPVEMGLCNDVMSQYAAACCCCASEIGLPYIDLYTEMIKHQDWKKFVNVDGLHLAKQGGELLHKLLVEKLSALTAGCKEMFPHWSEVDTEKPSASLRDWSPEVRQL